MTSVLLFCGAFDPITQGHMLMLQLCINTAFFKEIRVMPSGCRTDKAYKTTNEHRRKMCELAIKHFKEIYTNLNLTFCDYEMNLTEPQDSYFTVKHFNETEPDKTFYFFIGSDILGQMFDWPHSHELIDIANFLIAYRPGADISPNTLSRLKSYKLLDTLLSDQGKQPMTSAASSTQARSDLNEGRKCGNLLLHPKVMEYVEQNSLYDYKPDGTPERHQSL